MIALTTRSRSQPTRVSSDRSSSPVPTNSCQRASTSPRSRVPSAEALSTAASASSYALSASSRSRTSASSCAAEASATSWVWRAMVRTAPSRVCLTTPARASASAASDPSHPLMSATSLGASRPSSSTAASWHDEERRVLEAAAGQHPGQVRRDRLDGVDGSAIEDDGHRGGPLGGLAQEVPRHLVGVAGRGGHEEPHVGGGEQLGGQGAVALLDRVDVGGVEDRQPRRHRVGRHELESRRGRWSRA